MDIFFVLRDPKLVDDDGVLLKYQSMFGRIEGLLKKYHEIYRLAFRNKYHILMIEQ